MAAPSPRWVGQLDDEVPLVPVEQEVALEQGSAWPVLPLLLVGPAQALVPDAGPPLVGVAAPVRVGVHARPTLALSQALGMPLVSAERLLAGAAVCLQRCVKGQPPEAAHP